MTSRTDTRNSPILHPIPDPSLHPEEYITWLGIAPLRRLTKSRVNCNDCNLFYEVQGLMLHVGMATGYSIQRGINNVQYRTPMYNLYIYVPLIRLYRLKIEELYIGYLKINKDPYYVWISNEAMPSHSSMGTIIHQDQKMTKYGKNLS